MLWYIFYQIKFLWSTLPIICFFKISLSFNCRIICNFEITPNLENYEEKEYSRISLWISFKREYSLYFYNCLQFIQRKCFLFVWWKRLYSYSEYYYVILFPAIRQRYYLIIFLRNNHFVFRTFRRIDLWFLHI